MALDWDKRLEVIGILERWYRALEIGVADNIKPNLTRKVKGEDWKKVDSLITAIDDSFTAELNMHSIHWEKKGITEPPNFNRLKGGARLAFYQDLYEAVKDIDEEDLEYVYLI